MKCIRESDTQEGINSTIISPKMDNRKSLMQQRVTDPEGEESNSFPNRAPESYVATTQLSNRAERLLKNFTTEEQERLKKQIKKRKYNKKSKNKSNRRTKRNSSNQKKSEKQKRKEKRTK